MSKKLTPWFPADERPARQGYYEIRGTRFHGSNYRYWDGAQWGGTWAPSAIESRGAPREDIGMYAPGEDMTGWRGLASNPMTAGHTSKGQP